MDEINREIIDKLRKKAEQVADYFCVYEFYREGKLEEEEIKKYYEDKSTEIGRYHEAVINGFWEGAHFVEKYIKEKEKK